MGKIKIQEIAVKAVAVGAGAVVASMSDKFTGNLNPKVRSIGKIMIGAILPALMPKSKILADASTGFIAVGAVDLMKTFQGGEVSGVGENDFVSYVGAPLMDEDHMSGADDFVAGDDDYVAGDDDYVAGDDDDVSGLDDMTI